MDLHLAHISMQSTDTSAQQRSDAARIFTRAKEHGYAWITGTEANTPWISDIFRAAAHNGGYVYAHGGDVWMAIAAGRISGVPIVQWNGVVDGRGGDKPGPHFPNRGVLRVTFKDKELDAQVTVLASHFQTKRTSKVRPQDNKLLAERIETLARQHGVGKALVFYGGDQNITDRTGDTFKGAPLTSCWDELGKWPNTGHDNIDVIASYDRDKRVSCKTAKALPDKIFGLNTDHFLIEATYVLATGQPAKPLPPPKDTQPVSTATKKFQPPSPTVVGGKPAKHSGTDNKPPTRVVIHSAVMPCEPGRARQLAEMNTEGLGGGSWHYAVDPVTTLQCSYDRYVCWHAPPNNHSIGIEMADSPRPWPSGSHTKAYWAKLTKSWRWRTPNHSKMLVRTANLTAELCLGYNLPLVFLSPRDLRAGKRGITIHANVSKAFGQSSHWDPGAWPRFRFMRLVRAHAKKLRAA